jgi:hypothetical protein
MPVPRLLRSNAAVSLGLRAALPVFLLVWAERGVGILD